MRKEIKKKFAPREIAYRAEVKGIEGVVGKEGNLRRVLESSTIETECESRSPSEIEIIVPLVHVN